MPTSSPPSGSASSPSRRVASSATRSVARTTARADGDVISFLAFSIKRAWQGFWRNAAMSLAATATMTLMLMLLAGFWVVQSGLLSGLDFAALKVQVVADLNDNPEQAAIENLERALTAMPEVRSVNYVSKDEALKRFRASRDAQG